MKISHPLLTLIASPIKSEPANDFLYFYEEFKILRARILGQIHSRQAEREKLLNWGGVINRVIEELLTVVSPATFYR